MFGSRLESQFSWGIADLVACFACQLVLYCGFSFSVAPSLFAGQRKSFLSVDILTQTILNCFNGSSSGRSSQE